MWHLLAQQQLNTGVLVVSATATGGGLWWVVRLIWRFQKDVVEGYSKRIGELEGQVKRLEGRVEEFQDEREDLRRHLLACATERGALRTVVRQNGIQWDPKDWEPEPHD